MSETRIVVPLTLDAVQSERLCALQQAFVQACNWIAPVVREHRCWSRVALHHLVYRSLRTHMPMLGSQMVCNAIWAVSRAARLTFQCPTSPFYVSKWLGRPLPLLRFADDTPVLLDQHTLRVLDQALSVYTLQGRLRIPVTLSEQQRCALTERRFVEAALIRQGDRFEVVFRMAAYTTATDDASEAPVELAAVQPLLSLPSPDIQAS